MTVFAAVNGHDTPDKLLARFVVTSTSLGLPAATPDLVYRTWLELGSPAGLCLVSTQAMNRAPGGYLHVLVGDNTLAWHRDPAGRPVVGVAPHDMRVEVYDAFAHRVVVVDTRTCRDLAGLVRLCANEIKHACGLGRTDATANEPDEPGWQRKLVIGLAQSAQAALRHR